MNVALCFYGLVGSKIDKNGAGESLDPRIAYCLNKKNIIDVNDADVFIHSWSVASKKDLEELYQPKLSLIEGQRLFPESKVLLSNIGLKQKMKEFYLRIASHGRYVVIMKERKKEAFRAFSRWYSSKQVLKLKSDYEKSNDFKYDAVILIRLDVGFYTPLKMIDYDLDKFHVSHWNDYPNEKNNF